MGGQMDNTNTGGEMENNIESKGSKENKENKESIENKESMENIENMQGINKEAAQEIPDESTAQPDAGDVGAKASDAGSAQEPGSTECCEDGEDSGQPIEEDGDGKKDSSGSEEQAGEKKGFFKKNKKKDKKDEKIEELTDQVKRQMAEFDNFRKRTEKEKSQMYEIGAKSIIEKVLPVVDNFERGLAAVPEESKEDAFVDGMNKIYKQLMTMLEEAGVQPIEAVGKEFDPNLHNAVMQTESEEYGSGIIAQELQKGYMYRDSVVRHSMVAVVS